MDSDSCQGELQIEPASKASAGSVEHGDAQVGSVRINVNVQPVKSVKRLFLMLPASN